MWDRSYKTDLPRELLKSAAERLERIWYQQTYTTGWSGTLKAPVAEGGLKASRELASQQMTLPELVGEFRRLLTDIARDRQVLIGIDELDKIESRKKAYRFMNEMKVLFGAERCFFLISVSEDAMSAFERRGLPFRDVFDSSFDDVVNVGFLDVDESVALLQRRLIGMPLPFIFLCHSVAGGLARDLIRVAREVVVSKPPERPWLVSEACAAIVRADVAAKVAAALIATRGMAPESGIEDVRRWLQQLRDVEIDPAVLTATCFSAGSELIPRLNGHPVGKPQGKPAILARELAAFLLYAATLLEFFDTTRDSGSYEAAHRTGQIEQLARARQNLALQPRLAWNSLMTFRTHTGGFLKATVPELP